MKKHLEVICILWVPLTFPLCLDRDCVLFPDVFPMTNTIPGTWEALCEACWMRKGNRAPGIIYFLWKYHVFTMSHSFLLFSIAGEFTSLPPILFPTSWRYLGFWRSFVALAWILEQPYDAAFHLFLKFWNGLWYNVGLFPSTSSGVPDLWDLNAWWSDVELCNNIRNEVHN